MVTSQAAVAGSGHPLSPQPVGAGVLEVNVHGQVGPEYGAGEREHRAVGAVADVAGDEPGAGGEVAGDSGEAGDAQRDADLVAGHHQAGGEPGLLLGNTAHGRDRDGDEHRADARADEQEARQDVCGVGPAAGAGREQEHTAGHHEQPARDHRPRAELADHLRRPGGGQGDRRGERQEFQPGLNRGRAAGTAS